MSPPATALITDSTCDIPQELVEQYGIRVLPHTVIWAGQQYRDRIDIQPEEVYQRLAVDPDWPSTAQISVQDFVDAFQREQQAGVREVVVITLSSHYSGAIQSAQQAARLVDIPVRVHDSRQVTMGLGWQVLAAARARAQGGGPGEMLAAAEQARARTCLYVSMDTLEYLYRGGRIGSAGRLVGSALNVKPLVLVHNDSGNTEPVGVAFTHRKVVGMLYEKFFEHVEPGKRLHVAVMHGNAGEEARALADRIRLEYRPAEIFTNITGPVLGIHTGPGAIALAGYWEEGVA